jgi:hypothetical protein
LEVSDAVATGNGDCAERGDSPSSWAPPLGEAVIPGVTFVVGSPPFDPFGVVVAVTVADGTGDVPPRTGRGETVAAGDAPAVWAEAGKIATHRTINVAPNKSSLFIRDEAFGSS